MSDMDDDEPKDERIEVDILGRNLGTASGWDGEPFETIWFYDFEPSEGIDLQKGQLQVNFQTGEIGIADDGGEVQLPLDIISFLSEVAKQ